MDQRQQLALIASWLAPQDKPPGMFQFPPYTGLHSAPGMNLPAFEPPGTLASKTMPPMAMPGSTMEGSPVIPPSPQAAAPAAPMAPPQPPQAWQALNDQSRTAAFDPIKDTLDPGNAHVVDDTGRVNPVMSPGGGALPDVQSAIDLLVKQGVLGPEWARK